MSAAAKKRRASRPISKSTKRRPTAKAKSKAPRKVRRSIPQVINTERARILADDSTLYAAMRLVSGLPLSRMDAMRAVRSGAFGNVFGGRLTASYDAAQTNNLNVNHWSAADALAADAANSPAVRKVIRQRARYECSNNCIAKGIGESKAMDLVGCGPRLHIDDERLPAEVRAQVEARVNGWLAEIRLAEKLRTMRRARRVDGESFMVKITNERLKAAVKLDVKLIEAEQVASPQLAMPDALHVDGIDFDRNGNPVAYHVLKGHPGDPGQSADAQRDAIVPAEMVIHWFRQDRPGQHRGISEMTAGLPLYALLRRYNLAVVQAAESAADFAMYMKTTVGADGLVSDGDDVVEVPNAFDLFPLQRNIVTTLPDGYDIGQTKPEQPTNTHDKFVVAIVREIARNENVSLNVALGDSGQSSFSSGQLDHRIYFRPLEVERSELDGLVLDNLLADWLREAVLIEGYLPQEMRTRSFGMEISHTWCWDSNELGDPLKLAASKATLLKNGLTTIPELYAARNQDWRKAFSAAAASMGLTFEEYQEMVRDAIFAGSAEQDTGDDEPAGEGARVQPQQKAARKASA